jgi:hypothetical protein
MQGLEQLTQTAKVVNTTGSGIVNTPQIIKYGVLMNEAQYLKNQEYGIQGLQLEE